ncbi:MAG: hypothetical protein CMD84_02685 [Gammaproteobacteria bacterium]|nr:hypothetical protein [Gammaproteobacteria bacterium]|tara:strand:+ start:1078 stop:1767 length:690 start_codon:yes stop_codon:yes gene_type:complete
MKILADSLNKEKAILLQEIIKNSYLKTIDDKIHINLKKNEIYIINNNYKVPSIISINHNKILGKKNNSIFLKLFPKKNSTILDCTAGLARDGYILKSLGFNVTMIEKNPLLILMIRNFIKKNLISNLTLYHGNSYDFLCQTKKIYDYVYIDFMFNKIKTKSLSSKNDEFLKTICNDENNKNMIISKAIKKCKLRVVVKEAKYSKNEFLKPDYDISTKLIKYNIYNGSCK